MSGQIATLPALLPYALELAAKGWPVFPLHTPDTSGRCSCGKDCANNCGKHPRVAHGLKEATTDPTVIRAWWSKWPDANIGLLTGERSGLLVADVDPRNAGDATWEALAQEHDTDPITLTADTGSGGFHVYYQRPTDAGRIKSRANAIPPGVDCKCDGGYVVAPPSLHFSGRRYAWRRAEDPVEPTPAWLRALVCAQPKRATPPAPARTVESDDHKRRRARAYLARMDPAISGQGGHLALWKAALAMVRGFDLSESDARALLLEDYNPRCSPPWSESDITHKVADAQADAELPRGYLAEKPAPTSGSETGAAGSSPPLDLATDSHGTILKTLPNVIAIIGSDPEWAGVLGYDAFACREVYRRPPPWFEADAPAIDRETIEDSDEGRIMSWIQRRTGVAMRRELVRDAIAIVAQRNAFHPVREYLDACRASWDGAPRMPLAAVSYLGAEPDDAHAAAAVYRWLIAAVKRVYEPGCQSDSMLVLEGEQGIRKSSALRALASDRWFADDIGDPGNKDSADALRGKWIIEIGELRWRRSDEDTRKAFLSRRIDHYRPAYGHRTLDIPRQCVLAATTNQADWQTDASGARRYWAVACSTISLDGLRRDRDHVWGEAVWRYQSGEQSWLTDEESKTHREALHERREADPWEAPILEWAATAVEITVEDALQMIGLDKAKRTQVDARRVCGILRRGKYGRVRACRQLFGSRPWVWVRASEGAQ